MCTLSPGCSSQLSVKPDLMSVALCLLLSCSCCIFGHRFLKESITWSWASSSLWILWSVVFGIGQLMTVFSEMLSPKSVKTGSNSDYGGFCLWVLPLASSPKSCGCKAVGRFSVPNLLPWYHNPLTPTPHSLALLWAEIYTQEMENITFCLCLCVCVISLIWN